MVGLLWLVQKPSIYTDNINIKHIILRFVAWTASMCDCIFVFVCICVYSIIGISLRLYCVVWGQTGGRRKQHRGHRAKLDMTDCIGAGGKYDCSLQVAWKFDITGSLTLTIHQTKQGLQKWPNVK